MCDGVKQDQRPSPWLTTQFRLSHDSLQATTRPTSLIRGNLGREAEAVTLAQSSNEGVAAVARSLGVDVTTLRTWLHRAQQPSSDSADHGEMFERGISGHMTNALYQPVIRTDRRLSGVGSSLPS